MAQTMSSRAFTRDVAAAKKASVGGPVFITDRGRPAHVLLTMAEYQRLTGAGRGKSLLEAMEAMPDTAGAELDLPRRRTWSRRPLPDFSIAE